MPEMESATPPWRAFERQVAEVLAMSGYDVSYEQLVLHKKVDLLISKREFGKTLMAAVECKCYDASLTLADLREIEIDYLPLYENKAIEFLLILSLKPPAPAALTKIRESRFLRHQTIFELRNSLMDFRAYLYELEQRYKSEGLDRYYIPLLSTSITASSAQALDPYIGDWLSNESSNPIALLGSYGSGKSTFLLHLAQLCAARFRNGTFNRVPILIPLSEICSEQTIEGLLGRHFTHLHPTPGYNFQLFQNLNRAGHFLLLLDGFDEMKHSMTPNVFRYTFREVLKLVLQQSKVILSGRPSAFLSREEHMEFLRAMRMRNGREIPIADQPQFGEVRLAQFNETQISTFIDKYREYLVSERSQGKVTRIPEKAEFLRSPVLMEIARRPVQLKMLFVVLPAYPRDIDQLSVRELYSFFVDLLLEREASKDARKMVGEGSLKSFLEALAYFVWLKGGEFVGVDDIPDACFKCATSDSSFAGVIRRDLVSGSFVEVRYPDRLFFPHRSILEYLVAEFALDYFRAKPAIRECAKALASEVNFDFVEDRASPEVIDFMIAASGEKEREGAFAILKNHRRPISEKVAKYFLSSKTISSFILSAAHSGDAWALALLAMYRTNNHWDITAEQTKELVESVAATFQNDTMMEPATFIQRLTTALLLFGQERSVTERNSHLDEILLGAFNHTVIKRIRYKKQELECRVRPDFVKALAAVVLESSTSKFGSLMRTLLSDRSAKIGLTNWFADNPSPMVVTVSNVRFSLSDRLRARLNDEFDEPTIKEAMKQASEKRKR